MHKSEISAAGLLGYRVRAVDGEAGAVRDLVVDPVTWQLRYLGVDADAWAPGHEVLIAPASLGAVDEARRELTVELELGQVRSSPALQAGSPVVRDFEENWYRHYGWQGYWHAEVDDQASPEPPVPPAPPAEEPTRDEPSADSPGLLRLENLLSWPAVTTDRVPVVVRDLLFDDSDWSVDYLEFEIDEVPARQRCVVDESFVVGADPVAERLYLSVDAAQLHRAPRRPHPGAGEDCEVKVLDDAGGG